MSLIVHYSVVINWRYMLTGMPAMTPLVANYLLRLQGVRLKSARFGFAGVVLSVLSIAVIAGFFGWPMGRDYVAGRALAKDHRAAQVRVAPDSL